jgi:hypothetical protein
LRWASRTVQCGSGCVNGTPGVSASAAISFQSIVRRSPHLDPLVFRLRDFRGLIVERHDLRAARGERHAGRKPRTAEAEDGDLAPAKDGDGCHVCHGCRCRPGIQDRRLFLEALAALRGRDFHVAA